MKIIKTYNWNRRDFSYDEECEHCGHIRKNQSGYDDSNYYNNVMPNSPCPICKETTNSKETSIPKTVTIPKYDEFLVM